MYIKQKVKVTFALNKSICHELPCPVYLSYLLDAAARRRRLRGLIVYIYIYKAERVSVCLSVCMYVRYARLNRLSDHNETLHTCT